MMRALLVIETVLMLALPAVSAARAELKAGVLIEIHYLLGQIEVSGCEFNRNGIWYGSKTAYSHLRDKYERMRSLNVIDTTEDFIEKVATGSEDGGPPYRVRCNGGNAVTSSQWLREEMVRFRTFQALAPVLPDGGQGQSGQGR